MLTAMTMMMDIPKGLTRETLKPFLRDLRAKNTEITAQANATTDEIELLRLMGQMDLLTEQIQNMIDLYRRLPE